MTTLIALNGKEFFVKDLSWRLLSDFVLDHCRNVIKEDEKQEWQEGYGKIISQETAVAIADQLEQLIEKGVVERFRIELELGNLGSHFSENDVRKFIQFSRHSGGFDIW